MRSFEQVADWVTQRYTVTHMEPFLLALELSLDQGRRRQSVFLSELMDEDGGRVLRISTAVADREHSRDALAKALEFNWQSRAGYLALGEMGGRSYLHLCENRAYPGLDATELERALLRIGGLGDGIERQLQGGDAF